MKFRDLCPKHDEPYPEVELGPVTLTLTASWIDGRPLLFIDTPPGLTGLEDGDPDLRIFLNDGEICNEGDPIEE